MKRTVRNGLFMISFDGASKTVDQCEIRANNGSWNCSYDGLARVDGSARFSFGTWYTDKDATDQEAVDGQNEGSESIPHEDCLHGSREEVMVDRRGRWQNPGSTDKNMNSLYNHEQQEMKTRTI